MAGSNLRPGLRTRRWAECTILNMLSLRPARPEGAGACGAICFEAFRAINAHYGFPPDFPSLEAAVGARSSMFSHSGFWCVVAEQDGRIIGSNCLDERSEVCGVGPITVD